MKDNLKVLRKEYLKISQQEMAEKLNITQSAYAYCETGKTKITERIIADICREFNVRKEWLESGKGEPLLSKSKKDILKEQLNNIIEKLDDEEIAILEKIAEKIKGM